MVTTQSTIQDDPAALKAELASLSRTLTLERQNFAAASRANEARLAELHGVIAELLRRRRDNGIVEESEKSECESTTQPAGELEDDNEKSRTDQNDTSSMLSGAELSARRCEDNSCTHELNIRFSLSEAADGVSNGEPPDQYNSCLGIGDAKCGEYCHPSRTTLNSSCERERGSSDDGLAFAVTASPGPAESRQAKIASRVRLKKTSECSENKARDEWVDGVSPCSRHECDAPYLRASLSVAVARISRLAADCRVLECALDRARDTSHRLSSSCAVAESTCDALCVCLEAADRALETYDVLLALAETERGAKGETERVSAELVASRLLSRLSRPEDDVRVLRPRVSPGPWLDDVHTTSSSPPLPWTPECEQQLRAHAARLKAACVERRPNNHYDVESQAEPRASVLLEMEAAVIMQEEAREAERKAEQILKSHMRSPGRSSETEL